MDLESPVNILPQSQDIPGGGVLLMRDTESHIVAELAAGFSVAVLTLGATGFDGRMLINNAAGQTVITVSGHDGDIVLNNESGSQSIRLSGPLGNIFVPVLGHHWRR